MKKFMLLLAACLPMFICTACGDDDDNDDVVKPSKTEVTYYLKADLTTLTEFDITVSYLDQKGQVQQEVINQMLWSRTLENVNPGGMKCEVALKESAKEASAITIDVNGYIAVKSNLNESKQKTDWGTFVNTKKEKVEAAGKTYQDLVDTWNRNAKLAVEVDKKGSLRNITSEVWK